MNGTDEAGFEYRLVTIDAETGEVIDHGRPMSHAKCAQELADCHRHVRTTGAPWLYRIERRAVSPWEFVPSGLEDE